MKIYLAGEQFMGVADKVHRRLFSYWYNRKNPKHIIQAAEYNQDLFLDSGAYTAYTQNVDIDIEEYAAFIHQYKDLFSCISNLDDTSKNEQKSYDNQKALESLGCIVQPVFHAREDERWLIKYIDEGYDYIFIGGLVPETTNWLMGWLDDLFDRILAKDDGTPRVKLHGFGLTDQQLMFRYPWYSVDSTSWLFTGSFGGCVFMTPQGLKKVIFSLDSPQAKNIDAPYYFNLSAIERAQIDKWLERHGVTAQQCAEHYANRNVVNSTTFYEMEALASPIYKRTQMSLF